jgi:hypothetical protein
LVLEGLQPAQVAFPWVLIADLVELYAKQVPAAESLLGLFWVLLRSLPLYACFSKRYVCLSVIAVRQQLYEAAQAVRPEVRLTSERLTQGLLVIQALWDARHTSYCYIHRPLRLGPG